MTGRTFRAALLACLVLATAAGDRAATGTALVLPGGARLEVGRTALAPSLGTLRALLVSAAYASPAYAQEAGSVVLDDVRWTAEGVVVTAPRVAVAGTALTRQDLAALLDAASPTPWTERLARLSAAGVSVPELRVAQETGGGTSTTVYRDLRAGPIAAGRIATLTASGATLSVAGGAADAWGGSYGAITASDVDLAGWARLYGEGGDPAAPATRLYGALSADTIAFANGAGVSVKVASVRARDLAARPLKGGWREATRRLGAVDSSRATPEARAALVDAAADLIDAFEPGSMELAGVELAMPEPHGEAAVRVARVAYDGTTRAARAETIAVSAGGGRGTLDGVTLTGFSSAASLRLQGRQLAPGAPSNPLRSLVPTGSSLHLDRLALELPGAAAPVRVGLRGADLGSAVPVEGIPTQTRLVLDGFTLALPPGAVPEALAPVAELGYRDLDLSSVIDGRWDPATNQVALREVSLTGKGMGTARLTALVGGITKDVLDPDVAVAQAALLGATAKAMTVELENAGLFERVLAQQAKAQSLSADALRREYGRAATLGIPAVLGNSPTARTLGQVVASFIAKPGRLTVTATAKDGQGLGMAQIAGAGSPAAILDRLTVTGAAQ